MDSASDNDESSDTEDDFCLLGVPGKLATSNREQTKEAARKRSAAIDSDLIHSVASLSFTDDYQGSFLVKGTDWTIKCSNPLFFLQAKGGKGRVRRLEVSANCIKRFLVEKAGIGKRTPQHFVDALRGRVQINWAQTIHEHKSAKLSAKRTEAARRGWANRRIQQEFIEEEFQKHLKAARERKQQEKMDQEFIDSGGLAALQQRMKDDRKAEAQRAAEREAQRAAERAAERARREAQRATKAGTKRKQTEQTEPSALAETTTSRTDALEWLRRKARKARRYFAAKNIHITQRQRTAEQRLSEQGASAGLLQAGKQIDTAIQNLLSQTARETFAEFMKQNETAGMKRVRQEHIEMTKIRQDMQLVKLYYTRIHTKNCRKLDEMCRIIFNQ